MEGKELVGPTGFTNSFNYQVHRGPFLGAIFNKRDTGEVRSVCNYHAGDKGRFELQEHHLGQQGGWSEEGGSEVGEALGSGSASRPAKPF